MEAGEADAAAEAALHDAIAIAREHGAVALEVHALTTLAELPRWATTGRGEDVRRLIGATLDRLGDDVDGDVRRAAHALLRERD